MAKGEGHVRNVNGRSRGVLRENAGVTPNSFVRTISAAKEALKADNERKGIEDNSWRVDVHDASDYNGDKLVTTPGGSTFAVTQDGDIISVIRNVNDTIRGSELLEMAVKAGGRKLDSFDGNHGFYTKNGFMPVSRVKFDENYAPEGWVKGVNKKEDVFFYKYVGKENVPNWAKNKSVAKMRIRASASYEEAMKLRDESM